uniref:ADP-ribosylation factor n=1 Tax=Vannella robusta TaxID=1487602 RepID=A0A7S4HHG3_9EUKA|mmetsp:Transcript_10586/g.13102  ORF Transcript_10586/g.13102 Transcript_10586/m.13102 type:complete len:208 (+) Transcript_10586:110-733(+)
MGNTSPFASLFGTFPPSGLLVTGIDAAGKSALLQYLAQGLQIEAGVEQDNSMDYFAVERITHKQMQITSWDVGGSMKIRPLLLHYYKNMHCIVFVVNRTETERIMFAKSELYKILQEEETVGWPILIFLNFSDQYPTKGYSELQLCEKFELTSIRDRHWFIQPCTATTGHGVLEGFQWLRAALTKRAPVHETIDNSERDKTTKSARS